MSIMSCVPGEVRDAVGKISQQAQMGEQVSSSIRGAADPLIGGMWRGQGASAFGDELMTRFMPQLADLIAAIGGFSLNLSQATSMMEEADGAASGIVNGIVDSFDIF
jgi:WXG100 family type VII secretion target